MDERHVTFSQEESHKANLGRLIDDLNYPEEWDKNTGFVGFN